MFSAAKKATEVPQGSKTLQKHQQGEIDRGIGRALTKALEEARAKTFSFGSFCSGSVAEAATESSKSDREILYELAGEFEAEQREKEKEKSCGERSRKRKPRCLETDSDISDSESLVACEQQQQQQQQEKIPRTVSPPKIIYPSVTEVQLDALTDNKRRILYTKKGANT